LKTGAQGVNLDKLLDNLQAIHRFLIVATIALVILGMSINPSDSKYSEAQQELTHLENTLRSAYDKMNEAYQKIYDVSELHEAVTDWAKKHGVDAGKNVVIETLLPRDLATPTADKDTTVTVGEEVAWADTAFHGSHGRIGIPLILCEVNKATATAALDSVFSAKAPMAIRRVIVRAWGSNLEPKSETDFRCSISIEYTETYGKIHATKRVPLLESGVPVIVDAVDSLPLYEYNIADFLKGEEFGDWEDRWDIYVPAIREVWSEVSAREIPSANAYLDARKREESEKAKLKIDFLGASLDAPLALVVASVVVFSLQLALVAYMMQIRSIFPGNETAIRDSVFPGVVRSVLGMLLLVTTVLIFPVFAAFVDLVLVLHSASTGAPRTGWFVSPEVRWALVAAIAIMGAVLMMQVIRTIAEVRVWESRKN
jgi:hypothetical protein